MKKPLAYSKTIYDTLLQAYRPYILRIMALMLVGFLGRYLILSNAQIIGEYLDKTEVVTSAMLGAFRSRQSTREEFMGLIK